VGEELRERSLRIEPRLPAMRVCRGGGEDGGEGESAQSSAFVKLSGWSDSTFVAASNCDAGECGVLSGPCATLKSLWNVP
jgi:hypothetical protein